MKEAIIYLLFDNWCNSGHEPEVIEADVHCSHSKP